MKLNFLNVLICFIDGIFQGLAATYIVNKQLEINNIFIKKRNLLFFFIGISLYSCASCLFIPNQYRFLLAIIVITLLIFLTMKIKNTDAIIYTFNTEIIIVASEIIGSMVIILFGITSIDIVENLKYNLLANILISILGMILIKLKFIRFIASNIFKIYNKNKKILNYIFIILLILYLLLAKNGLEFVLKSNYYINILFIIGICIIILIIINNETKSEKLKEEYVQMLNYVTKYEKIITEQGKNNHEFKNQLMVIRGYAQMNNNQKLIGYIDSIIDDSKKSCSTYLISQLNKFPDGGIKGLLYYKLSIIEEEKIKYEISVNDGVKTKLNNLNINMYKDITKILGVLIDNAIDASKNSENKNIIILVQKEKDEIIFNISNTYKGKIDLEKIGTGYTSKGKGHGYGLKLVKDILKENNNYRLENDATQEYYTVKLFIDIQKRKK